MRERLRVNEIYRSIQGESRWSGRPCTFVRLTGCHLRCEWCDSEHAFYEGTWQTIDQIMTRVAEFGVPLVELTGGEPLLQPACGMLAQRLRDHGYTVLCETSGSLPIDRLPAGVVRIMDIKCPASGEMGANDWENISRLRGRDEVKFVIAHRGDYDWAVEVIERYRLTEICEVLMSPVFGSLEPRELVQWILDDELPVRFQLQIHKYIWEPSAIGV